VDVRLEAQGLRLARGGRTVLEGMSAVFEPGTVTAILGPNGAGKSTLLEALAGLLVPEAGAVTLDGAPLAALSARARARAIGYLLQGGPVHWNLRAAELVALGRLPHRGPFGGLSGEDRAAIGRAMALADVDALGERPFQALSGGERARVLLARVLAGEPRVLLADEPLANLDPRHALETLHLLRAAADGGAAVVLVLHDLNAAARAADRLMLLAGGRVLGDGNPRTVLTPAVLREAYGVEMRVLDDPAAGLLVVPRS
jgi:iron complex transport system ATP-binding protein